jgi:hypothetical protein
MHVGAPLRENGQRVDVLDHALDAAHRNTRRPRPTP